MGVYCCGSVPENHHCASSTDLDPMLTKPGCRVWQTLLATSCPNLAPEFGQLSHRFRQLWAMFADIARDAGQLRPNFVRSWPKLALKLLPNFEATVTINRPF